ncbi:MAG: HutD family protein [Planctomycetes bacterium]|nr:HutD family protein [Planctomycetota bacterium]
MVPWRNGGGTTREVAIDPPGASAAADFRWRISIAGVAADGPFSRFPGVDRSLWLLGGDGLELDVDGRTVRLDRPLQRIDFAGEAKVAARLLGGPTSDLNVMVARAGSVAAAQVVALADAERRSAELAPGDHVLLALAGSVAVSGSLLQAPDAVRFDGAGAVRVAAAGGPATLLLASFLPR